VVLVRLFAERQEMSEEIRLVKLSQSQFDFITTSLQSSDFFKSIHSIKNLSGENVITIQLPQDKAEVIRIDLVKLLAAIGFDIDDEINANGHMVESLIDKFTFD
jgi:hypothetical protein